MCDLFQEEPTPPQKIRNEKSINLFCIIRKAKFALGTKKEEKKE